MVMVQEAAARGSTQALRLLLLLLGLCFSRNLKLRRPAISLVLLCTDLLVGFFKCLLVPRLIRSL
jgi:hypothetical protein